MKLVNQLRSYSPDLPPIELLQTLVYRHNKKPDILYDEQGKMQFGGADDKNVANRFNFIKKLYPIYNPTDKALVRFLLEQEVRYAQEHEYFFGLNISSFMLYKIMDVTDVPLLYDAKFNTCFDARFALDIELVFGLHKDETKDYYTKNPDPERDIVDIIKTYEKRHYRDRAVFLNDYESRMIPSYLKEVYE